MDQQDDALKLHETAVDLWRCYLHDGDLKTLEKTLAGFRAAVAADGHNAWFLSNLSNTLLVWYERTGDRAALEEAVTVGRLAVASSDDPAAKAVASNNLSGALKSSCQLTGDIALLEEASAVLRSGVANATDEPTRGVLLSNLAGALEGQYARTGTLGTLRESVQVMRQGLMLRMRAGPVPREEFVRLANLLQTSYERTNDSEALDEAISVTRQAVSGAPPGAMKCGLLSNLGVLLRLLYERTGSRDVLDEAAEAGRAAVAAAADDRHLRASAYSNLGNTLRSGYERTREGGLLSGAVEAHREAVAATADDHQQRALILTNADRALELSYESTKRPDLLDERVRLRRERLATLARGTAERADELVGITEILRQRFEVTGEMDALNAMIETLREAIAEAPANYPARPQVLSNLGIALQVGTPGQEATAEAVAALGEAVAEMPEDDPGRSSMLTNLARAHQRMYELTGDLARLKNSISAGRAAIAGDDPDQRARGILADSLQALYERTGDDRDRQQAMELFGAFNHSDGEAAPDGVAAPSSDAWVQGPGRRAAAWMDMYLDHRDLAALDRAVEVGDRLLTHPWLATVTPDAQAGALAGAGLAHLRRYEERSDNADLEEALRCCAASVEFTDHENYRGHLNNFALALRDKYERDGDVDSLVRAADLGGTVVEMTPELSEERADALTNLGGTWRRLREATGDAAYLDAEVDAFVQAAEFPAANAPNRARWLNNAAVGLHQRYDTRGDEVDLQRSIEYSRQALHAAAGNDRDRSGWLSNLGNTLRHRYERTGALADLDDAIDVLERAEAAAPRQWKGRRQCLTNLGSSLRQRGQVSGSTEFLRRALRASAEAVELTPPTSPEYALYAANLAVTTGTIGSATGDAEHLNAQISLYEELLDREPETSPRRPWLQANLASSLLDRVTASKDQADLHRAIELARDSLIRAAPGTSEFAHRSGTLAGLLALGAGQDRRAVAEAETAFRQACGTALGIAPAYALSTALQWARWGEDEKAWATAAEAYLLAAKAADRLFATQIDRQDKETWLRAANGMPAQAAVALVRDGQPEGAAMMLERGRVRLLSEALGRNSAALDTLEHQGHGALAERFRAAQRRLGALDASAVTAIHGGSQADRMRGDDLSLVLSEHAAALEAIRRVPGYEHFLLPAEPADLADAADQPVVYLAAARLAGVALIITRTAGDDTALSVQALELPQLTGPAVHRRAMALQQARQRRERDPALWDGTLDAVCRWLWVSAMGPVLDALAGQPAACLVPAGLLASLPLHASWTPDGTRATGRRYALDLAAFSYAPGSVALLHARELAGRQPPATLLGVADPQPVDAKPLALAPAEVAAAAALLGGPFHELHGPAAGRVRILAELPRHSFVHFACHGQARPDAPLDSALLTSNNERLTLRELFRLELAGRGRPGIRLAVLSACETQIPGMELPDELVGLPSGFLQAGAAAVVASQWNIGDAAAALLTTMFYRNLVSGADGATALRDAQVWLRDTTDGEKAAFMHPRTGQSGLPPSVARPLWRWLARAPVHERSFGMPSQWAAMTYTGA